MKKKILGSLVCTLLIAAAVLPVAGTMNVGKSTNGENNNLEDEGVIYKVGQDGGRQDDYDWQVSGNNVLTGHGYPYPTGNVGIGTQNPAFKLTVSASVYDNYLVYINSYNTVSNGLRVETGGTSNDNYALRVQSNLGSTECLAVTNSGNVGIGTTSPSAKLDVEVSSGGAATIGSSSNIATGNFAIATGESTNASGEFSTAMGGWTNALGSYSTAMGGGTTASSTMATAMGSATTASGAYSTAMGRETTAGGMYSTAIGYTITVDGSNSVGIGLDGTSYTVSDSNVMSIMGGNVGIGTINPTSLLEVAGTIHSTTSGFKFPDGTTQTTAAFGDGHSLDAADGSPTDAVYVDNDGNVGIGTTSPSYLLHVLGGSGIVAQFSGRVKGAEAVNDDEFVTKSQVKRAVTTQYTPTGSSDLNGDVGETAWDSNYFYVKTPDGWKRAALETWESSDLLTK